MLVKYIFTSENLSVQVHPSDTQTQAAGLGRQGKEECWLIIAAEPGGRRSGVGFHHDLGKAALRAAALDGSIEQLLHWYPVAPGDFFMIPANTVHAIGAGVSLIEVQQNSDITYRLYDYGRPRELHLDQAIGRRQSSALCARAASPVGAPGPGCGWCRGRCSDSTGSSARRRRRSRAPYADGALLVVPLTGEMRVLPGTRSARVSAQSHPVWAKSSFPTAPCA